MNEAIEQWDNNYQMAFTYFATLVSEQHAATAATEYANYCDTTPPPVHDPRGWLQQR
jgi:hypothetical protein